MLVYLRSTLAKFFQMRRLKNLCYLIAFCALISMGIRFIIVSHYLHAFGLKTPKANNPMKLPLFHPDTLFPNSSTGKEAIFRMLSTGLPLGKWLSSTEDRVQFQNEVDREIKNMNKYSIFNSRCNLDYWVDGWACINADASFRKIISLKNKKKYKIIGYFVLDDANNWRAEAAICLRVLTPAEVTAMRSAGELSATESIEIIPTVEQAREALTKWLRTSNLENTLPAAPSQEHLHEQLATWLHSTKVIDSLLSCPATENKYFVNIDDWHIFLEDRSFEKCIDMAGMNTRGPIIMTGMFTLLNNNVFDVTITQICVLLK